MKKLNDMTKNLNLIIIAVFAVIIVVTSILCFSSFKSNDTDEVGGTTYAFDANIVEFVSPMGNIAGCENSTITFTVKAKKGINVHFKVGTQKFESIEDTLPSDNSVYTTEVTLPKTKLEIDSMGDIIMFYTIDGQTTQTAIGHVVYQFIETTTKRVTLKADNSFTTRYPELITSATNASNVTEKNEENFPQTDNIPHFNDSQMCVISANFADVRQISTTEADYVPFTTPLIKGTTDYIVSESEIYDEDEDETFYFFNLASGMMVKRDAVELVQKTQLQDNTLQVISSTCTNGELAITLKTDWKIPYSFSYSNQDYFSGYDKDYNVTNCTATSIEFKFNYTTQVIGGIDASGSDVVSSANFTVQPNEKVATLSFPLLVQGQYFGYNLKYDANNNLVIIIKNKPTSLQGSYILLDPGHGGKDSGAIGLNGGVYESNLNFAIAQRVKAELTAMGATVEMTRYSDEYFSLEERKDIAREKNPDLFISIHCNASPDPSQYGVSTYYFKPMSQPLAESIYNRLDQTFKTNLYADEHNLHSGISDDDRFYPFSVTRLEDCPSVLLEIGYVSNENECLKLLKNENLNSISTAICTGIDDYFSRYN